MVVSGRGLGQAALVTLAALALAVPVGLWGLPAAQPDATVEPQGQVEAAQAASADAPAAAAPQPPSPTLPIRFEAMDGSILALGGAVEASLAQGRIALAAVGSGSDRILLDIPATAAPALGEPTGAVSHYILGSQEAAWRSHVPRHASASYDGLLPGIDLVWHARRGPLEFDVVAAPGSDPSALRLAPAEGTQAVLAADGSLTLSRGGLEVAFAAPVAYQDLPSGRAPVDSAFVLDAAGIGFEVGAHDEGAPLVIDPYVIARSTYYGGDGQDLPANLQKDLSDNFWIVGQTGSTNLLLSPDAYDDDPAAVTDGFHGFLAKFDATSNLVYATYFGGMWHDYPEGLDVDNAGFATVAGWTRSPDYPMMSPFDNDINDGLPVSPDAETWDAFVTRFTVDGSGLVFSTFLGGGKQEYLHDLTVDNMGFIYVTGETTSTDFPVTSNALQPTPSAPDAFVTVFDPTGTALHYSSYLGGSAQEVGWGIHGVATGLVLVSGVTFSGNFPLENQFQGVNAGDSDAFVTVYDTDTPALLFSTYLGGPDDDAATMARFVPGTNDALIVGRTEGGFQVLSAFDVSYNGGPYDGFMTRMDITASTLDWSGYVGGSGYEDLYEISFDQAGNAWTIGGTSSADYPVTADAATPAFVGGGSDAVVTAAKLDGTALHFSTFLGGTGFDNGRDITVPLEGSFCTTGETLSSDFPTLNAMQGSNVGVSDSFLTCYGPPPPPPACSDGIDNDGDGYSDYPNDPGCSSPTDEDEWNPPPAPATNKPPVVAYIPARNVHAGETVTFTVNGYDPEGEALTWGSVGLPAGATFDPVTRIFTYTPSTGAEGTYCSIQFIAQDPEGAFGTTSACISVSERVQDTDRDGVRDRFDNCPELANHDQGDWDRDGLGDGCDTSQRPVDRRASGAPAAASVPGPPDTDRDGVADPADNCVHTKNRLQEDLDGDNEGDACDPDLDGDGVPQWVAVSGAYTDNCPRDPNRDQEDTDIDGPGDACDPVSLRSDATGESDVCANHCSRLRSGGTASQHSRDSDGNTAGRAVLAATVGFLVVVVAAGLVVWYLFARGAPPRPSKEDNFFA